MKCCLDRILVDMIFCYFVFSFSFYFIAILVNLMCFSGDFEDKLL